MALPGLNYWMLHADALATQFDLTLRLTPWYNPVRVVESGDTTLTFFASLLNSVQPAVGPAGSFQRNSQATYRAPMGMSLDIVADNESRHEYSKAGATLGILMEPASTNKCENYNANPDAALTNVSKGGDAAAVLSRVSDVSGLNAAGLQNLCTSGFVIRLDNTAGSTDAWVSIVGASGNINEHYGSVYWRGSGNASIGMTALGPSQALPMNYERFVQSLTPPSDTAVLQIFAEPGADLYFVLNQLEEDENPTTVIITQAAPASRAIELTNWPIETILNQAEGMAAIIWRPVLNSADIANSIFMRILFSATRGGLMYFKKSASGTNQLMAEDNAGNLAFYNMPVGIVSGQEYLILTRWNQTEDFIDIGLKTLGALAWGNQDNFTFWSTSDDLKLFEYGQLQIPNHASHLYFWNEDKGRAWLESFFAGSAN